MIETEACIIAEVLFKEIRTAFTNAFKRAKLTDAKKHALLSRFASRTGMCAEGDGTLEAFGWWKEPKMIRQYMNRSEERLREAVEMLAENSPANFTTPAWEVPTSVAAKCCSVS